MMAPDTSPDDELVDDDPCMCDFAEGCGGLGTLRCLGCGGDNCICTCGGETECNGCEDCLDDSNDYA